ncbi:MAG: diguanylate cyclase [Candidatus Aegiribacteria sp.]|nr:diguanylate cyclase [Candidatus Aegiribacteria sp.]
METTSDSVADLKKKNALLQRQLNSLELVFRNAVDILVVVDAVSGTIQRISDAVEAVLGYKRSNLIGKKLTEMLPDESTSSHLQLQEGIPEIVDGVFLDQKVKCYDGSFKSMDTTISLVSSNNESVILLTLRDTSQRKRHQSDMIKKNSALDSALSAMIIANNSWKIDYANVEALNYWRYSRTDMLNLDISDLLPYLSDFDSLMECIEERGQWDDEIECQRRDSTTFMAHATAIAVDTDDDNPCYILSFLDITKRVRLEKRLTELSLRDSLTGLYNRRGFMTLGKQLLDSSLRKQPEIGLLYVDLDYLKLINDKLGHSEGDRALVITARVLKGCFRDSDIIARLGGDEFVVLFLDTPGLTVESIRTRIDKRLNETIEVRPIPFTLSLSIGYYSTVLCYKTQIGMLLSNADSLMYEDKEIRRESISGDDVLRSPDKQT